MIKDILEFKVQKVKGKSTLISLKRSFIIELFLVLLDESLAMKAGSEWWELKAKKETTALCKLN